MKGLNWVSANEKGETGACRILECYTGWEKTLKNGHLKISMTHKSHDELEFCRTFTLAPLITCGIIENLVVKVYWK